MSCEDSLLVHLMMFFPFVHLGWGGRPGRSRGGRVPRSNGELLYLIHYITYFVIRVTVSSLLCQVLFWYSLMHLLDLLDLFALSGTSGNSWSHGSDGPQGRAGECFCGLQACRTCHKHLQLPAIMQWIRLSIVAVYCQWFVQIILTVNGHIVPLQGARGLDGDPGPQGVAGATVSLSVNANIVSQPM